MKHGKILPEITYCCKACKNPSQNDLLCVSDGTLNAAHTSALRRLIRYFGPTAWNSLLDPVCNLNVTEAVFRRSLKMFFVCMRHWVHTDWCAMFTVECIDRNVDISSPWLTRLYSLEDKYTLWMRFGVMSAALSVCVVYVAGTAEIAWCWWLSEFWTNASDRGTIYMTPQTTS